MITDRPDLAHHWEVAVRRSRRSGASLHDAEDCVQQAALEALLSERVHEGDDLERWLTVVARRRHVDRLRRRARERSSCAPDDWDRTTRCPEEVVADASFAAYVVQSILDLPTTTRRVVTSVAAGMSVDDVAVALGLTKRAVESHVHRARVALRMAARRGLEPS